MVSTSNLHRNVSTIVGAIAVKFLFVWLVTYFISVTQYLAGRIIHFAYKVIYVSLFAVFIFAVSASIDKLQAQGSDPVITIERNPYIAHDSTFQAEYIFVSDIEVTADITINYEVVPSGGGSAIAKTATMSMGLHEARGAVSETHTEVRLLAGMNYTVGSTKTATYVLPTQVPDGKRGLQLRFDRASVIEGGEARLTFRATPPVDTKVPVGGRPPNSIVFGGGQGNWDTRYFATAWEVVETSIDGVGATYHSTTINFATNMIAGDSTTVTVTPDESGPWTYEHATTTIQLIDDDGNPQVSIESNKAVITEGESIELTVSALPLLPANSPLVVNYMHNNSPYANNVGSSISLTNTEPSKDVTVTTHDRTQMDGDGEIVVTLSSGGSNYDLVNNKSVAKIKVLDKQTPRPRISTSNNNVSIVDEGATGGITFKIESDTDVPTGGLIVYYELSETGNFVKDDDKGSHSVTISSGRSANVDVELKDDDSTFTQDSTVTLKVLTDINSTKVYLPAQSGTTASVFVKDLGRPSDGIFIERLSSATISEGEDISFQVGAPDVMDSDRKIKINYGGLSTGNFLSSAPSTLVTIPANLPSVNVSLSTTNDTDFDVSGTFEIGIAPAEPPVTTNYTIASTKKSFELTINDSDARGSTITGISIHAVATTITREKVALFRVIAPDSIAITHTVSIEITEGTDNSILNRTQSLSNCAYHGSLTPPRVGCNISISHVNKFAEFSIALNDNFIDGESSTITARIASIMQPQQNAAAISTTHGSTTVTIMDDDAPPVMKLAVDTSVTNNAVVETDANEDIEFEFSVKTDSSAGIATTASASDVTIQYSVTENVGDFLMASEEGDSKTATLTKNMMSVSFNVSVNGDGVDEVNGNFTVTLKPDVDTNTPKTYTVSQVDSERTIEINVIDDEVPIVTITTSQSTVSESEDIIVNLATDIAPHQDLEIDICVSDGTNTSTGCSNPGSLTPSGDFLKIPLTPIMVTLPVGANSVSPGQNYTIELDDDSAVEGDGSVIVYFAYTTFSADPTGYALEFTSDTTKSQISVMVEDNDPTISIAADDSDDSIVEGEDAVFTITSNAQITAQQLLVQVKISQEGEYWDLNNNMTKGSTPLEITLDQTSGIRSIMVPIPVGSSSASFTIGTDDDAGDGAREDSGSISAEIIVPDQNPKYSKGSNFKAVLNVVDNDDPTPEISIQSVQTDAVEEGETIIFELTSNKAIPDNGLEILVCIRDGTKKSNNTGCTIDTMGVGDYLAEPVPKQITMPANAPELTVRIEVPTVDDNSIDLAGTIYAEVLTNSDDDSYRPLALRNSATVQITDNDPSLSISPKDGKGVIAENEGPAEFVITSNVAPTSQLSVRVIMSEVGGNYLRSEEDVARVLSINFPAGQTEVDFPFDIDDDINEEVFGGIRAELDSREQFTVGYFVVNERDPNRSSSAVVIVNDDDGGSFPTISIAGVNDAVNEGEDAVFEVTTTPSLPLGSTLPVQIMVEEGTPSYIADSADLKIHTVMIRSGVSGSTGELTIKSSSNSEDEVHGSIKATIQSDSENYRVASVNFATVAILDDDGADIPAVSIITTTPNITEGNTANFMVKSARSRDTDLIVNINIADPNNFIIWRIPNFVTIPSGEKAAGFTIATGTQSDEPGNITVAIVNMDRYDIVLPMMQVVEVQADDDSANADPRISVADVAVNSILELLNVNTAPSPTSTESSRSDSNINNLPQISIIAKSRQVDEGQPARFVVTSRHAVGEGIRISVSISGTAGAIANDSMRSIVMNTQQREVGFEIPTIDDDRAEADGYVIATLVQSPNFSINGDAVAVVTISDATDRERRRGQLEAANREVIPNLHNALGVTNWSNVSNRIGLALAGESQPSLVLGGQSTINEILTSNAQVFDNESWTLKSFLGNSSFSFDLTPGDQGKSIGTVWGLGEQQTLSRNENNKINSWTADMFTAQFGSDVRINDHSLIGLSVAVSDSVVDFGSDETTSIQYELQNNNFQSYLGWQSPDLSTQIRVSTGIGLAEIELNQDDYDSMYLQSINYSLALQGNSLLYSSPQ